MSLLINNLITLPKESLKLQKIEDKYAPLYELPAELFAPVLTHSMGLPVPRAIAVGELRQHLLQGQLPSGALAWPAKPVQSQLLQFLQRLGIARYCYQNEEVTDALLVDILKALDEQNGVYLQRYPALVELLKKQELEKLEEAQKEKRHRKQKNPDRRSKSQKIELTADRIIELETVAEQECWEALFPMISAALDRQWLERLEVWREVESVFRDLQLVARLGYDLCKGIFQSHGWLNIVRLRDLLEKLPELQDVIRSLGRMQQTDGEPILETIMEAVKRQQDVVREVKSPLVPMEMRGVTRSDSISRMLPQEAALLGHPVLKGLWHAKRSEQALLSYAVEGVELETITTEIEEQQEVTREGKEKRLDKGPVLVCLDTSGSMSGSPEQIAKALVLETLRVAGSEKRDCYVYLFGSTNEVAEMELSADRKGMDRLISFLSMSFGGGTDVQGPVEKALAQCKQEKWQKADILIVSDGEFGYADNLLQRVKRRKTSHGLRVHGVLIGHGSSMMEKLCDPLHQFDDWRTLLH